MLEFSPMFLSKIIIILFYDGFTLRAHVLETIYIISPSYYRIYDNKCPFSLYNYNT